MLRDLLDKFLNRDLAARRKSAYEESDNIDKRTADLKKSLESLDRRNRQISDRRVPDFERRLDRWVAQEGKSLDSVKADRARFEAETEEIKRLYQETDAEIAVAGAEATRLLDDQNRVRERLDAVDATERQRFRNLYRGAFLGELVSAAIWLIPGWGASGHIARSIHLDYYSAVAGITPVLLVAGFVEVAVLGFYPGRWMVLCFSVPAIGATAGALVALASHRSTANAFYLTTWGLGLTLLFLIVFFIAHSETSSRKP